MVFSIRENIGQSDIFFLIIAVGGCEKSINPISPKGTEYTVYGPLNIGQSPNHIRLHDTNSLLNPESTRELDVNMVLTNLKTGESDLLIDNLVKFNNIYTHNYQTDLPINYDSRYKVFWEDGDGFRDSLITQTTKQSVMTTSTDTVHCDSLFYVELTNIDLEAGEKLDAEAVIHVNGCWWWLFEREFSSYDTDSNTLTLGWSPYGISYQLFAGPGSPHPDCVDFTRQDVRFRFNHIGYMIEEEIRSENELSGLPENDK